MYVVNLLQGQVSLFILKKVFKEVNIVKKKKENQTLKKIIVMEYEKNQVSEKNEHLLRELNDERKDFGDIGQMIKSRIVSKLQ